MDEPDSGKYRGKFCFAEVYTGEGQCRVQFPSFRTVYKIEQFGRFEAIGIPE
jgi:hypothetical protein